MTLDDVAIWGGLSGLFLPPVLIPLFVWLAIKARTGCSRTLFLTMIVGSFVPFIVMIFYLLQPQIKHAENYDILYIIKNCSIKNLDLEKIVVNYNINEIEYAYDAGNSDKTERYFSIGRRFGFLSRFSCVPGLKCFLNSELSIRCGEGIS